MMTEQPFLFGGGTWIKVRDGNPTARAVFDRHYSRTRYRDGRDQSRFVGPGARIVLLTPCVRGLFVWREFFDDCIDERTGMRQEGINCSIFRNEGAGLSSELIRAAMSIGWERWPGRRLYTYVNPRKVKSSNPGYCFQRAGWRRCGITKTRKLIVFEALPFAEVSA